jgi:EAL domain-containing protein (putative c-di-GMP-specific phosphodiesterase class I)
MARSLEISVTAEGVETLEQLELLRELGCDRCQGYLFSRPVPAESFRQLLGAWSSRWR